MRNKYKPFFYEKKKSSIRNKILAVILITAFLLYIGMQVPRIRQVIAQPLFAAGSFTVNTAKDFFDATRMYHEPTPLPQTYDPLELPDEQVLFAESLESLSVITQADPLADLRQTPTESEYSRVAEWEYLDPNLNYAIRSNGAVTETEVKIELIPPVFERADINNDGAAILSALLRYWGITENQYRIAEQIHPNGLDPVISLSDIRQYIEQEYPDFKTLTCLNGDTDILSALLQKSLPVLIRIRCRSPYVYWLNDDRIDSQYIIIHGYDSTESIFTFQDTRSGNSSTIAQDKLMADWYPFQRELTVIYPEDRDDDVREALSENYFEELNLQKAEQKFRTDSEMLPNDPFAQFNYAVVLHRLSDEYGAWEYFQRAENAELPQRHIGLQTEILETALRLGYADEIDRLTASLLRRNSHDEELTVYSGWAALLRGDRKNADSLIEKAEKLNPNNEKVRYAVKYIETMIQ